MQIINGCKCGYLPAHIRHTHIVHMYLQTSWTFFNVYIETNVHMYICMHMHILMHLHTYIHTHMHPHTFIVHIHTWFRLIVWCMHEHIHTWSYMHTIIIHSHEFTHLCIHTHCTYMHVIYLLCTWKHGFTFICRHVHSTYTSHRAGNRARTWFECETSSFENSDAKVLVSITYQVSCFMSSFCVNFNTSCMQINNFLMFFAVHLFMFIRGGCENKSGHSQTAPVLCYSTIPFCHPGFCSGQFFS